MKNIDRSCAAGLSAIHICRWADHPVIAKILPTTATWLTVELSCGHKAYGIPFSWDVGHSCRCHTCEYDNAQHFVEMAREMQRERGGV